MKRILFLLLLLPFFGLAQYPQKSSTLTITEKIIFQITQSSHGLSVGDWITINGSGGYSKGSDPSTQSFIGIVSTVPTANTFTFVGPGGTITGLSGLTAGSTYYAQEDGTISTTSSAKPVLIATSTTTGVLLSGSFGALIDPPDIQATMYTPSDITSDGVTLTVTRGNGTGGVIFLLSDSPINVLPQNNTDYSGIANANFSLAGVLGSSAVRVIQTGTSNSVVASSLDPATLYYALALEYDQSGVFITYNLTINESETADVNSKSFTTLADVTTPTTQWVTTNVKPKQNQLDITGTRGNGDYIIVVANDSIPVAIDPADGSSPVADAYGNGTHFGDRNYCVYIGSSANFSISGLARDKKYYYKIMEVEDTGNLYNTIAPVDSAYTAWIYDGGTGAFEEGVGDPAGQDYLESNANVYAYYDFGTLTFADEANITNGDAGLTDRSTSSNTATIVGSSPKTDEITLNSQTVKTARGGSGTGLSTGNNGTVWFSNANGFEVHFSGSVADGQTASGTTAVYGTQGTGWRCDLRWVNDGRAQFQYTTAAGASNGTSTAGILANGVNVISSGRLKVDFINDLATITVNGTTYNFNFTGTALSAHDPTTFSSSQPVYIGNHNSSGSPTGNTSSVMSIARIAFTGITTTQQSADIGDWMAYTATAGAAFTNIEVIEPDDFDQETVTDSLHLSNQAPGLLNYMKYIPVLPDSLEQFDMYMVLRVSGALTTNPSGIGIGIQNLVASEDNRTVMGQINLDTDATSTRRAQIFSGNGTVSASDITFKAQSNGQLVVAFDSVNVHKFTRTTLNNDAFYGYEVMDGYDSSKVEIGWLSPNRPGSEFFGTTMRPIIWYQGPGFMIGEFWIVRTADPIETTPPAPVTPDYRADRENGSDSNPCTNDDPCYSANATVQAANADGGEVLVYLGPGIYNESSRLIVDKEVSIRGAGVGVTIITGTSNLFQTFGESESSALIQLKSNSFNTENHVSTTQTISNLTLDGNLRQIRYGLYVNNRDGVTIEDVSFVNFNWAGMWMRFSDDSFVNNVSFESCGGDNGTPTSSQMNPPLSGSTVTFQTGALMVYNLDNVQFTNITLDNRMYRSGYGVKAYNGFQAPTSVITDCVWDNLNSVIHPNGGRSNGTEPNLNFELWGALFNNCEIRNSTFNQGIVLSFAHNTATAGDYTGIRVHHCNIFTETFALELAGHNCEIDNNYMRVDRIMHQGTGGPADLTNHNIHHNIFEVEVIGALIYSSTHRLMNFSFQNNTIAPLNTFSGNAPLIQLGNGSTANVPSGSTITIGDIALAGQFATGTKNMVTIMSGSGNLGTSVIRNNFATHYNTTQSLTNTTSTANQTNLNATDWFNHSGTKFNFTSTGYYYPKVGSALRDAGNGSDDVGAVQH